MKEFHYRIGRQFGIYPWLININGGASLKQPVWTGDVAAAIRLYCEHPEQYAGKTMELAGPEVMQWAQIVEWFKEVTHTKKDLPRTPTSLARLYAGFLELGPKPYISRSEVDLRVTDCISECGSICGAADAAFGNSIRSTGRGNRFLCPGTRGHYGGNGRCRI